MKIVDSLKRLFITSKDVSAAKTSGLKEKANQKVETAKGYTKEATEKLEVLADDVKTVSREVGEKVRDFGENLKEKAEIVIEKLDDKAAGMIDKLEEKIRNSADEVKEPKSEAVVENGIQTTKDSSMENTNDVKTQ